MNCSISSESSVINNIGYDHMAESSIGDATASVRRYTESIYYDDSEDDSIGTGDVTHFIRDWRQSSISLYTDSDNVEHSIGNEPVDINTSNMGSYIHKDYSSSENIEDQLFDYTDTDEDEEDYEDYHLYNQEEQESVNQFEKLTDFLTKDESNETIDSHLVVNVTEIIIAVIVFSKTYSLPHSGVADLFKMINSFLDKPALPETRYKIDKLFYPKTGQEYHSVCPTCKCYVGVFNHNIQTLYCDVCQKNINLKDPSYRDFFVNIDPENDIKHLIENNADYYSRIIAENNQANTVMEDIHHGKKYQQFVASLLPEHKKSYVSVTFNSDGSPLFKSSKFSVWPIQIMINEVPLRVRTKNTIVCSIWFGHDKPKMTYFLQPFVRKMNDLARNGIECKLNGETKKLYVYCICSCDDSVARAPMQGISLFNGFYGGSWYLHPGVRVLHKTGFATKYPLLDEVPKLRTAHETFENMQAALTSRKPVYDIKNATPLIYLNRYDVIHGFVPDSLHCIDKGIGPQFCDYWFHSTGKPYSFAKHYIDAIDECIKSLKVPTQIAHLSRSIKDRKFWKASEWSNFILFYSVPVLSNIIPGFEKYIQHWSLLVEGYHLLLKTKVSLTDIGIAHKLFKRFICLTQLLYGEDAMSYNVHQLWHVTQSTAHWGPLFAHWGYGFESGNGRIIQTVHAAKGVINQICRSFCLNQSILILEKHLAQKEYSSIRNYINYLQNKDDVQKTKIGRQSRYFGNPKNVKQEYLTLLNRRKNELQAFNKMVKNGCVFKASENYRSDNRFAILTDNTFIKIEKFLVDTVTQKEWTIYKKLFVGNSAITEELHSMKKIHYTEQYPEFTETGNIERICVHINITNNEYILPLPNMYSK
ncbi:uncharacterized protein LOC131675607 isoform X1 [Phymastichus coffea]|uniref:uncharacterized protein LOC131675607 isoform X1 n=1 Tax=Phymastichus coffea TaxID=108790 RepID=UPI00273C4E6D|nr:uncharacterized protein LOC131675607 isoform X1 [Phymastichus coffea]XP_058810627.1 uncharacterized protein LOC131675607 isoform X1 [Phymastichus coffea]XP_058810628.1 uncharacterized protein LOC131675607 isoform X1 [Phymastichus coffea]